MVLRGSLTLYGLKSSGAAFRSYLADHLWELGCRPSKADGDVLMRPGVKPSGFKYWEYICTYVDDLLSIGHQPQVALRRIGKDFTFKDDKVEPPKTYLGGNLSKMFNDENKEIQI